MSSPRPLEEHLLEPALQVLEAATRDHFGAEHSVRLEVLEAAASRLGGFSLEGYRKVFADGYRLKARPALALAEAVVDAIRSTPIPPAIALSALARPLLSASAQRRSGAYYTDFRLAQSLAETARASLVDGARIIDPACGTGILLVAAVLAGCGADRLRTSAWLRHQIYAADLSPEALRGARLALAALTDDLDVMEEMSSRWREQDSLLAGAAAWRSRVPAGFDVVIGNPPWEKLKLSRHEFLRSTGQERHYGEDYGPAALDLDRYTAERDSLTSYVHRLGQRYALLGTGEPDLYQLFLELFFHLARGGGCVAALVPAGLIRSQGAQRLREFLFDSTTELELTILENRSRFFSIDTRFKFVALRAVLRAGEERRSELSVLHAQGTEAGVERTGAARISRQVLREVRPDLTVPEVRSDAEWRIFRTLSREGIPWGTTEDGWSARIVREVDMTNDRQHFSRTRRADMLPLVEGRMIQQHRFGAKRYVTGSGRRARWDAIPFGESSMEPQFWYPRSALSEELRERACQPRIGFCDITGQTNERSMQAALIPPGVICGNKVPTITFPLSGADEKRRLFLWLAIANSIPFDWLLRRVVTTTINYFVLLSVPLPRIDPGGILARRLSAASQELHEFDQKGRGGIHLWDVARLRAQIDVDVLEAYKLGLEDLQEILKDFPLLDRSQPALPGEERSTVTQDFLMSSAARRFKHPAARWEARLGQARKIGAIPYIPSEFGLSAGSDKKAENG
ncbi:MAG: Eco57I restriction-modification methylase domain-containing protein [Hyalangium sp.]|uniref:Eco57I restriction-modification methylase domain-containing protein n=1 Tax=Hyalangium sp. TaxID=2028555 RepID=UPI00389B2B7C